MKRILEKTNSVHGVGFSFWGEKVNENIILTVIELTISIFIEGIILSFVFNWISNLSSEKQQKNIKGEMNNIETQNKFIYEQLQKEIRESKMELISQIKESAAANKKGGNN